MSRPEDPFPSRLGWLAAALVAVVVLVNAAGIWGIAAALRELREQGVRTLQLETTARASAMDTLLASTTADLAFLVGSPYLVVEGTPRQDLWRDEVGGALLIFLRGHDHVRTLVVRDGAGRPLLQAGRPRGVPGYWVPGPGAPAPDGPGPAPGRLFVLAAGGTATAESIPMTPYPAILEVYLDPTALLRAVAGGESTSRLACALQDAAGSLLAGAPRAEGSSSGSGTSGDALMASAPISAQGWSGPSPWTLRCSPEGDALAAGLAPVVARQRVTIAVNLIVMVLAAALGAFAFHQARQRQQLADPDLLTSPVLELERRLFHAERLGTVGRLAAGMAHEINNPLEGMANYLRLADDTLARGEEETARRHLQGVRHGLDRAAGIVRRVLDHSRASGSLQESVDLVQVVNQAVEFVRSWEEFAGIRFETDLPSRPTRVLGNSVQLGQVYLNLLLNACEAQPRGGAVRVTCRVEGRHVETEIADQGPGVPPERRAALFEPFAGSKMSAGLGLSICQAIVLRHGGELTLEDREGWGAVFRIRLALQDDQNHDGA